MAFALLHNLYLWVRAKTERRLCLAVLGVDGAGKTTLLHTVQGNLDEEVTPTMGFNSAQTTSGALGLSGRRFTMQVFDLGGGRNIRRVWKSYLAEVHAVVFVVDAADGGRLPECKQVLHDTAGSELLAGKPVLVFANKQDLPGAAPAAEVAEALGLSELRRNAYHIKACTAKTPPGRSPDARIKEGLEWLLEAVGQVYSELHPRVERDALAAREEEARKKREREEKVRQIREERARQQQEQQQREEQEAAQQRQQEPAGGGAAAAAAATVGGLGGAALVKQPSAGLKGGGPGGGGNGGGGEGVLPQPNVLLAPLPGVIESPKPGSISVWPAELTGGGHLPSNAPQQRGEFTDLRTSGSAAGGLRPAQPVQRAASVRHQQEGAGVQGAGAQHAGADEGEVRASGGGALRGTGEGGGDAASAGSLGGATLGSFTGRPNKVLPVVDAPP